MSTKSFSQLRSQLDTDFPLYTLVMYEHDGGPHSGIITGSKKDRYVVFSDELCDRELTKPRLHSVPMAGHPLLTNQDEQRDFFKELRKCIVPEIASCWELCVQKAASQEKVFHVADLAKLIFGHVSPHNYIALRSALIKDRIYFKRDSLGFAPRKQADIDLLLLKEQQRAQQQEIFATTAAFLQARTQDPKLAIPDACKETIDLLFLIASGVDFAQDDERFEHINTLLSLLEKHFPHDYLGRTNERAHFALTKAGLASEHTNYALIRHQPRIEFSESLIEESKKLHAPQSFDEYLDSNLREDYTHQASFTIDDASTKDMDDALFLEQTDEGYRVYVHITDVSYFIKKDSALDKEAKHRATSIYCPDRKISMFPEPLSNETCSLKIDQVRPAISVIFDVDHSFQILSGDVFPSVIKIARRLDYPEVDLLIHHGDHTFEVLHQIAALHEANRLSSGATPVVKRDVQPIVTNNHTVSIEEVDEQSPARALIGEMMVLANIVMANFLNANEIPALYRSQDIPDDDGRDLKAIPEGPARDYVERGRLKRSQVLTVPRYHATLGTRAYVQCTSPIRRYLDLVLQRQIISFFKNETPPYSEKALQDLQPLLDEPLTKAQLISRESKRFWLYHYIKRRFTKEKQITGTIVRIDTKFPMVELDEVYLIVAAKVRTPKLGAKVRLRLEKLDIFNDFIRFEEVRS
jgi:exoribonuclease-2